MEKIYFDYASTTPTDPSVIKAMEPYFFEKFGNPSSPHGLGQEASRALEDARAVLAQFIGAKPSEIIFTSSATESNNHAIYGAAYRYMDKGDHIIVSGIEHHSVMEPVRYLSNSGFKVTYLNVDNNGLLNVREIEKNITDKTILLAVIHASNEIGTIQPIAEIGGVARKHGVKLLVDGVQTVGHIPVDVNVLKADFLSLSAHKFYGPKGVGALYIREGINIEPFLLGGDQEKSRRASTVNVPGAVGLAQALKVCREKMAREAEEQRVLRDRLLIEVPKAVKGVKVNGHLTQRLPNNAHFSFENLQAEALLMSLDMNGIAASMGSACTAGALEPSHTLRAIGLSDELALGALRITLGRWTTRAHIDDFLNKLPEIVASLRI